MKTVITIVFATLTYAAFGQIGVTADRKFHEGSNLYINGKPEEALASVKEGLRNEPKNEKLLNLKKLLDDEKKKKDQQEKEQKEKEKQKQQQQQKDQQNKDQQNKDKEKQDQKDQEQKDKEQKEKEQQDEQKKGPERR